MSNLTVMIVEGDRYLINTESPAVDSSVEDILTKYPKDACIDFTNPTIEDVL